MGRVTRFATMQEKAGGAMSTTQGVRTGEFN
jgi:hypothetical protein